MGQWPNCYQRFFWQNNESLLRAERSCGYEKIQVHFSNGSYPHAVISEFYNVATSNPLDGSAASSTSRTAGTITTTQAGDLIYEWGAAFPARIVREAPSTARASGRYELHVVECRSSGRIGRPVFRSAYCRSRYADLLGQWECDLGIAGCCLEIRTSRNRASEWNSNCALAAYSFAVGSCSE